VTRRQGSVIATALFAVGAVLLGAALLLLLLSLDGGGANIFGFRGSILLLGSGFGATGWILASRRPENPIGWIFLVAGTATGVQAIAQEYPVFAGPSASPFVVSVARWIDTWIWVAITGAIGIHAFLLFPTGRLPSRRWRPVAWLGALGIVAFTGALAVGPDVQELGVPNPFFDVPADVVEPLFYVGSLLYLFGVLGAVAALVVRFRRSGGDERQQLRWFAAAAAVWAFFIVLTFIAELALAGSPSAGVRILGRVAAVGVVLAFLAVPITIGVAVLKYRLYDLDVVINKTVVFGVLAAVITGLYVVIVVGIGALVGRAGGIVLPGVAAAVVALAFQPIRRWAQHLANRLVYGKRATPYEVLSEFSDRVGGAYAVEDTLPRMARIVGEGTGAARAAVWLGLGGDLERAASWPPGESTAGPERITGDDVSGIPGDRVLPVRHQGILLGALAVEKPRGEALTAGEEKLLEDLAAQAGLVLRNVRLVEELRASRQRIVAAQDEERRRLERDIHDGAQQQLVALSIKLRLAETLVRKDPGKAEALLGQVKGETTEALESLRDLARGIYPPLLADKGLVAALEAQARKSAVAVRVHGDVVGRFSPDVEAGVYFCVLEALQNVAKYAGASSATVGLSGSDGTLTFIVQDDGRGFDPATTRSGSGLQNMHDRIEALGGRLEIRSEPGEGTTVVGTLPVRALAGREPGVAEELEAEGQHP
jgi:signal transduction histidine kinase